MDFIDANAHLSYLSKDRFPTVVSNSAKGKWVNGGVGPSDWQKQLEIKSNYPEHYYTAFGLHPWFVRSEGFDEDKSLQELQDMVSQADFMGEVGLDFFESELKMKKDLQLSLFKRQLEINPGKPLLLHVVQAHGKALEILNDFDVRGYVHGFTGSIEVAHQYFKKGLLVSFGAGVLNPQFKKAREAVSNLPIEAILIESDAPSTPNADEDPIEIFQKVAEEIASLRKIEIQEIVDQTRKNFEKLIS